MFDFLAQACRLPERFNSLFDILILANLIMFLMLKKISLERAWKNKQWHWFGLILIIQTFGILEMFYLLTNKKRYKEKIIIENLKLT